MHYTHIRSMLDMRCLSWMQGKKILHVILLHMIFRMSLLLPRIQKTIPKLIVFQTENELNKIKKKEFTTRTEMLSVLENY